MTYVTPPTTTATKAERREWIAKQSRRIWHRELSEAFAMRSKARVEHIMSLFQSLAAKELAKRYRAETATTIAQAEEIARQALITRNDTRNEIRKAEVKLKRDTAAVKERAERITANLAKALESSQRPERVPVVPEVDWAEKATSIIDPDLATAYAELAETE